MSEPSKITAKSELLRILPPATSESWLAVHELPVIGYSQNNLATRLSELARAGSVVGRIRKSEAFKEWAVAITPKDA
jgi:hypothetical protein